MRRLALAAAVLASTASLGVMTGGCSGHPTLSQWAQGSGVVGLDQTVASDVRGVFGARAAGKSAQFIATICDALFNDASQAYDSVLPSPNHTINDELIGAYDDLENGAEACSLDVGGSNTAATAHAYGLISSGEALLSTATRNLASLGVK